MKGHVSLTISLADSGAARVGDWPTAIDGASIVVVDVGQQTTLAILRTEAGWHRFAAVAVEAANRARQGSSGGQPSGGSTAR